MKSFRQQVEGGGSQACGEAFQHITLNKLMSQCQFATERHNSPETSVEVRLITSITAEPWLPGFSSRGERGLVGEGRKVKGLLEI